MASFAQKADQAAVRLDGQAGGAVPNLAIVPTGAAGRAGTSAAMTAGSITISTTAVTANSVILLTTHTVGGTAGILTCPTRTAGTSFVITSTSGTDTSTVDWLVIN